MKVVHVVPHYQEGLGYEENHLGFQQAALGAEVTIVTSTELPHQWAAYSGNGNAPKAEAGVHTDRGVKIRRLSPAIEVRSRSQLLLKELGAIFADEFPDILHLHAPVGVLTLQSLKHARAQKLPVVIDSHINYFNLRPFDTKKRAYYQAFSRLALPYYGSVVKRYLPHTPDAETVLNRVLNVDDRLVTQTSLGADATMFKFDPGARSKITRALGVNSDAKLVLFAGRITPPKDIDVLISAVNNLWQEFNLHLLLVGPVDDEYKQKLVRICDPAGSRRLHFQGMTPNDEMAGYFSAADVGVWPGDPAVSILEAMACSLPLILSASDTTRHLITGGNGVPFPRGDIKALTSALSHILSDDTRRNDMAGNSRALAENVFDWRVVARRTNQVYEEILLGTDRHIPPIWDSRLSGVA
ncbi:MAG: glycosyltransferase family 4 protein [SAR202 cluster bacterium]|nr:glycosyltransferase family 4 protein [SAR202 cluster bacterium]